MSSQHDHKPSLAIDLTEFRQGWRVLILALLGIGTSVGVAPLYSFGTLVLPLQEAFGWSREQIQPAIAFLFAFSIIAVQISGWMIRRYGLRPVAICSLVTLSVGFLLLTLMTGAIWQLYAGYALLAFAGMGTTVVTWTQLVNLWFERNRGLALAIILCGTGLAALVLPPSISWLISMTDWRAGFWVLAALPLLITLPLSVLWMRSDSPITQAAAAPGEAPRLPGMSLRQAALAPRFWLCNLALVLSVTSMIGMVTSTVPMLRDKGLSATDAALAFSVYGISLILGRVVVGYLVDRIWAPGVAFVVLSLPALGCLIFAATDTHMTSLMLASVLVGLGSGAEMDIAAFLMARYFGMRDYSRIFSLHMGFIGLGATAAPLYFAYLYAQTGSYAGLLTHGTVTFALGAVLILAMGRYPKFDLGGAAHPAPGRSGQEAHTLTGSEVSGASK
ncbi:MFS transporter [Pseudomonas capeferrum]|uniref:MFS transporter n=1 Tax=Pseudomonas capeferrum TaxID=1495066 RepID=UPI0015E306FF|nr:MFS transporter [Pseudomonas capeferrum]MBA1204273.1 MFS transporter [Pseudomonas capeferrum]